MFMRWRTAYLRMRSLRYALALVGLFAAAGCSLLPQEQIKEEIPVQAPKIAQKPEYEVKRETIELKANASGRLLALREDNLFFTEDNFRIKEVYVKAGDTVAAGQLLAELDDGGAESQLRRKEIEIAQSELNLKEKLRQADGDNDLVLQKEKLNFELLQAEYAELQRQAAATRLTAPYDGTIVSFTAKKGDIARAYSVIGVIADETKLTVGASFSQTDLANIAVGMEAVVNINTVGEVRGKVSRLPATTESSAAGSSDSYLLVEVDALPDGLSRGTPLSVSVIIHRKENVLTIPISALRTQNTRSYVLVSEPDGSKGEIDVEVGEQTTTLVEIVDGLAEGQKVVGK